jgi:hypothetical protein
MQRVPASFGRSIILVCTLVLSGCIVDPPCPDMGHRREEPIDEIVEFAVAHQQGWKTGVFGTPIERLHANFYVQDTFIGGLGVGSDFLTAQGCGRFVFRARLPRTCREAFCTFC